MKYRITVEKMTTSKETKSEYIPEDEREEEGAKYRDVVIDVERFVEIYSQTTEGEINLSGIINAVNNNPKPFKASDALSV